MRGIFLDDLKEFMKNMQDFINFHKKASNLIYSLVILTSSLIFTWTIGYLKPSIFANYQSIYFYLFFVFIFYIYWFFYSLILSKILSLDLKTALRKDTFTFLPFFLFLLLSLETFVQNLPPLYLCLPRNALFIVFMSAYIALKVAHLNLEGLTSYFSTKPLTFFKIKIRPSLVIGVLIIAYVATFAYLSIAKHNCFNTGLDLGVMDQSVWNTLQGKILQSKFIRDNDDLSCYIYGHFSPILLLFVPFYLIWADPRMLLFLKSFFIALGAIPLYLLAKEKLKNSPSCLLIVGSYLLYPYLGNGNLFEFQPDSLAPCLLLCSFYYLQKEAYLKYFTFILLSLSCKEQITFIILMMGSYALFFQRKKMLGVLTISLALLWLLMITNFFIKNPFSSSGAVGSRFYYLGSSPKEAIGNIFLNPWFILKSMFDTPEKIAYPFLMMLPVGFLSLLSPSTLLISASEFAMNLLSKKPAMHGIYYHYIFVIVPFIFISAVYGISNLSKRSKEAGKALFSLSLYLFLACFFAAYLYGTAPFSRHFPKSDFILTKHKEIIKDILATIPENVSIATENNIIPHLPQRNKTYYFPIVHENVDYIFTDRMHKHLPEIEEKACGYLEEEFYEEVLRKLLLNKEYGLIFSNDGVMLFKKGADYNKGISRFIVAKNVKYDHKFYLGKNISLLKNRLRYTRTKNKVVISCFFKAETAINKNYTACFAMQSNDKKSYFYKYFLYPTKNWKEGEIIREDFFIQIPPKFKTASYFVELAVLDEKIPYKIIKESKKKLKWLRLGSLYINPFH